MWEIILGCIVGVLVLILLLFLIGCVVKDRQMSKEWERLFKNGDRDD